MPTGTGLTVNNSTGDNGRPSSVINNPLDILPKGRSTNVTWINNLSFQLASDHQVTPIRWSKHGFTQSVQQTDVQGDDARSGLNSTPYAVPTAEQRQLGSSGFTCRSIVN
jgi:hypothetical protein